ncbi:endonuclease [Xanthomarina sp. F2636L]|uniref:endonuclease/exonuclease/phosphatase family protein n=1 Tax=Xanthomarina sp. F2636L TaxID=2996018 RepID=UPI00225E3A79|nr:endonuclease [Xanthomarina sp. F2636L]MCX7551098.1 endonuclease [Xanthomarina sp. F2636L]
MHTLAFYNTENFFEAHNDISTATDKKWTARRYAEKLDNISYVISKIGEAATNKHPSIVGLAEIENQTVLQNLVDSKHLKGCQYKYLYFPSKDERGINIALLYDRSVFEIESSKPYAVELKDKFGTPEYTRDILLVSGVLEGVKIHLIVNHWPSKRENDIGTEYKRLAASDKVSEIISSLKTKNLKANIIVMGDFNDNPTSKSVKRLVNEFKLRNPFETLRTYSRGSTNNNRQWHLFDQVMLTESFFEPKKNSLQFKIANIFDADFLKNSEGKHKGIPNRTFKGTTYHGGYSDHFPVYIVLKKQVV